MAVVGVGLAGAACAARLAAAGVPVTLFDKSRGVGGRMATRRVAWADASGRTHEVEFDHGAPLLSPAGVEFRALLARGRDEGWAATWRPRVHADGFAAEVAGAVLLPGMPALARRLTAGLPLRTGHAVARLDRRDDGWWLASDEVAPEGPFERVVLAMPPAQAAVLLHAHAPRWAAALRAVRMQPCWTLMAVTDDVHWPWDAAEPSRGPLALVVRNDRKPGRAAPPGCATWVAHATAVWSAAHVEHEPAQVQEALRAALAAQITSRPGLRWHHVAAHRWRFAEAASGIADDAACVGLPSGASWWDGGLGVGVCGDHLAGGGAEAAWQSGRDLAARLLAGEAVATARRGSAARPAQVAA